MKKKCFLLNERVLMIFGVFQFPRRHDAVVLEKQMVRHILRVLPVHDAVRDDESHAGRGERDLHIGRTG